MAAFKESFAAARKAGKKTFSWNGKSYNTKVAPDTPKTGPVPATRPASATSGASRSTSGKTSATSGASRSTANKTSPKSGAARSAAGKTETKIPYTRDDSFSSRATAFVADVTRNGLANMSNRPQKSSTSRANANKNVKKK